jgi:butyryl-CoA dehydrogenase
MSGKTCCVRRRSRRSGGHLRFAIPKRYGGKDGSNLWMAVIREHFAAKGLGLHNDLQNEHSIVGNFPLVTMLDRYGRDDQKAMIEGSLTGKYRITFGLTEPDHGSDATHMETTAVQATRDGVSGWIINGERCGPPGCTSPPTAQPSRARRATMAMRAASPVFSFRQTRWA